MTDETWGTVRQQLKETVGKNNFRSWIEPLAFERMEDGVAVFSVPSPFLPPKDRVRAFPVSYSTTMSSDSVSKNVLTMDQDLAEMFAKAKAWDVTQPFCNPIPSGKISVARPEVLVWTSRVPR